MLITMIFNLTGFPSKGNDVVKGIKGDFTDQNCNSIRPRRRNLLV